MIKVTFPNIEDQSAEYRMVVDFYKAIFQPDETQLAQLVTDDWTYVVHGNTSYEGKSSLTKMLSGIEQGGVEEVRIENIVADKKHAAINGKCVLEEGSKIGSEISFAEFLTFSPEHAKIQRVDAYPIVTSGKTD